MSLAAPPPDLPPPDLRQRLLALFFEAFRFGLVGVAGYVVDVAVLLAVVRLGVDPFTARVPSFLAAASCTWFLNRRFTFRDPAARSGPVRRQWALFVLLMLPGRRWSIGGDDAEFRGFQVRRLPRLKGIGRLDATGQPGMGPSPAHEDLRNHTAPRPSSAGAGGRFEMWRNSVHQVTC
jgi:hypothetical protein